MGYFAWSENDMDIGLQTCDPESDCSIALQWLEVFGETSIIFEALIFEC